MSPDVLRRKLQKKKKHRVYGKCPKCGDRTERRVVEREGRPRLVRRCWDARNCGFVEELFWSGGGLV